MNMKTVERYGHAAEASDEVLNPSGSPVHIGTVCEISHEFVGAHIHAGCSGGRRASGPDVSDPRGSRRPTEHEFHGDRPPSSARQHAVLRQRAATALSLYLSLSLISFRRAPVTADHVRVGTSTHN